jgi:hypothetical protein
MKTFVRGKITIEPIPEKLKSKYKYVIKYLKYTHGSTGWHESECEDYCVDQKDLLEELTRITKILK